MKLNVSEPHWITWKIAFLNYIDESDGGFA